MDISISKIKAVIEELKSGESSFKAQIEAYEKVVLESKKQESRTYSNIPFKKALDNMKEEVKAMNCYIHVLEQIVDCYEKTEQKIMNNSQQKSGRNFDFKNIDSERIKDILDDYKIKFI